MSNEPKLLEKEEVLAMNEDERHAYVLDLAKHYVDKVSPYDPETVHVEPQSLEDGNWYLYSCYAKAKDESKYKKGTYAVWTLNISLGGLHHGHYDLDKKGVMKALNYKRDLF